MTTPTVYSQKLLRNYKHLIPSCVPSGILGENDEGKEEDLFLGTRVTRAAAHFPVEEVKRRMKMDPRSWVRERWVIIYHALIAPRKALRDRQRYGSVRHDSAPRHFHL